MGERGSGISRSRQGNPNPTPNPNRTSGSGSPPMDLRAALAENRAMLRPGSVAPAPRLLPRRASISLPALALAAAALAGTPLPAAEEPTPTAAPPAGAPALFARDRLIAWCIVPFDAKQ